MPQKNWEKGYKSKHLGHEDIAAMGIMEILKHLKEYYGVTDIQPSRDITDWDRPPWSPKGDPVIHDALDCFKDLCSSPADPEGNNPFNGSRDEDFNPQTENWTHTVKLIRKQDVVRLLNRLQNPDNVNTF